MRGVPTLLLHDLQSRDIRRAAIEQKVKVGTSTRMITSILTYVYNLAHFDSPVRKKFVQCYRKTLANKNGAEGIFGPKFIQTGLSTCARLTT